MLNKESHIKPFIKWAGGKSQLLKSIVYFIDRDIKRYVEPFVGGGAVLFWVLQNRECEVVINDINKNLINTYKVIKNNVNELIHILEHFQEEFLNLDIEKRKEYYYKKRDLFNQNINDPILHAGLFIFLNKTCFNGLYRVNKKNQFNVPIGNYKNPLICDKENLLLVHKALKRVIILNTDFENTIKYISKDSFVYLDPPYKEISKTSNFTAYTQYKFTDKDQIRLKKFCDKIGKIGAKWLLSNSNNLFFNKLFKDYFILEVLAKRSINSNPSKRGKIKEFLITNIVNNCKNRLNN